MKYLQNINGPEDLKKIPQSELGVLAEEIRGVLLKKLSEHGGHCGPNLGMVEATIALHYVFHSPKDKIVFDVSHQSYVHKMLTGRKDAFLFADKYDDVTGYSAPQESPHDFFTIGHTSTSVSLAGGLAKGRDLVGGDENIIAVIGDGSLSGGEALEGLDFACELHSNFIIVVNDNQMSIAENHGGLYENLSELRQSDGKCPNNLFKAFGLDYVFVKDGNDVDSLIEAFGKVKDVDHPVVVHICTVKGKGFKYAEENKEAWHAGGPFDIETGKRRYVGGESYYDLTAEYLLNKMKSDQKVVAITSGTPMVMGFDKAKRDMVGGQFVDVGIAEEHAVALASGIAKRGGRPVYGVFSTFIQRAYDQISQDVCINNSPVTMLVTLASVYGMNDVTHLGVYDIPMLSNIPNLVYLAPTCAEEYFAMADWAIEQDKHPVAIRVPSNGVVKTGKQFNCDYGDINKYEVTCRGDLVAVLALGSFYQLGESVVEELAKQGVNATLVNPRYITGVDKALLEELKQNHKLVVTLEDGVLDGGFGEKIARYYGASEMKTLNYGLKKQFLDRYNVGEVLESNRLTPRQIVADVLKNI